MIANIYTHKLRLNAVSVLRASARFEIPFINLNNRSFLSECKIIPVPADPSNKAQHFN